MSWTVLVHALNPGTSLAEAEKNLWIQDEPSLQIEKMCKIKAKTKWTLLITLHFRTTTTQDCKWCRGL